MKKKIGLVGFGKIGKYIYSQLANEYEFTFIYDQSIPKDAGIDNLFINSLGQLEAKLADTDMVIECAVASLLKVVAPLVLVKTNLMPFSITAFADKDFEIKVKGLLCDYKHKLYIPHGAILGLDGMFDAKTIIEKVKITTIKSPASLGLMNKEIEIVYDGSTREACAIFPRNVNVHAAIAMTTIGFDNTHSVIVSDPNAEGNIHNIEIIANGCSFNIRVLSLSNGGVTGLYTPISAVASIRRAVADFGMCIA